jgi:thiamine biosynthesis lipoprotein
VNTREWSDWSCAVTVMAEVDGAVSRFRDDSDLARINAAAGRYVAVSPLTIALVKLGLAVADRTADAVTPTVGAALAALGYDDDISVVRDRASAPACTPAPTTTATVRIDHDLGRVGVGSGTVLDLGATAKAYAVDEAVRRIARHAHSGVLVSIGGDLAVHGTPPAGWTIAVSETAGAPVEMVTIDAGALATSSMLGRRWGADRHHIVDPRTGDCARGPWRTATVWAPTAVEANLLSTWALVDATAAATAMALEGCPARIVTDAGEVERRHGWPAALEAVAAS